MENPFKKDDAVVTKLKCEAIEATVTQTWKNEVQVKTAEGDLLWRTLYTVWRPGTGPLVRASSKSREPDTSSDNSAHDREERSGARMVPSRKRANKRRK